MSLSSMKQSSLPLMTSCVVYKLTAPAAGQYHHTSLALDGFVRLMLVEIHGKLWNP